VFVSAQSRLTLLAQLPKGSVGVEVGVFEGDFTEAVLQIVQPREMHLIDPWLSFPEDTYQKAWYGSTQLSQSDMDLVFERVRRRFAPHIATGQIVVHRAGLENLDSRISGFSA
jgi:hypothetical protein